MGLADRNQILFTEDAYRQLIDMFDDPGLDENFTEYTNVKIKHGLKINVFQYAEDDLEGLNSFPNEELELKERTVNVMNQFKGLGFNFPTMFDDDFGEKIDQSKMIGLIEKSGEAMQQNTLLPKEQSRNKKEK